MFIVLASQNAGSTKNVFYCAIIVYGGRKYSSRVFRPDKLAASLAELPKVTTSSFGSEKKSGILARLGHAGTTEYRTRFGFSQIKPFLAGSSPSLYHAC
jgi:hypothetical protein